MLTIVHPRPYKIPFMCSTCKHIHERKTYHLALDSEGYVIVSEGVLARLREINLAGMEIINEVISPPMLYLGVNGQLHHIVRFENL